MRPLHPTDLGLILSYKCQSACAHCLYNCGPAWDEWMTTDEVREALAATSAWDHPFQIHITGGEPFLNFPLLLHAVEAARKEGIPCYVETNAGWCVNENLVRTRLATLREAGLGAVLISCSPFHAETIPPRRTMLAIQGTLEVFGPSGLILYLPEWLERIRSFGSETTTSLDRYVEIYGREGAGRMLWEGYRLIPGGRSGYRLGYMIDRHSPDAFAEETCRYEILYAHHSHFDLYGNYISGFCGGLRVGDWHDLPTLLTDFELGRTSLLISILVDSGPFGLAQMATGQHGYKPIPEGYVGKCHLCVDVRRHLVRCREFPELRPREFYEMI